MTPAKIYPFSIPAGGSFPLLVIGDYCKILTSSGPLTLQGDTFGSIGPILAGQGVQDSPFSRLVLEDESGATNNGTILIADNAFIDDRITGEVSVIDGETNKTKSGQAFAAAAAAAGSAANYSFFELWNPAGSGKRVICYEFNLTFPAAGDYRINKTSATLGAALTPVKKGSSGTPVAKYGTAYNAAIPGEIIELGLIPAYTPLARNFKQPIILEPGNGVILVNAILNSSIYASAQFTEEAIL